ncbi:MAG: PPOX class F420-dependent oxidoreductase [Actinomycetota bacterium]
MTDLERAKYISFTSFRRDGTPVPTAVWVVPYEDGYAFTTDATSWKVKRIRANPRVSVQVCNFRGRPAKGAPVHQCRAVVLDEKGVADVQRLVRSKYRIAYKLLIERSDRKAARRGGSSTAGTAAIKVVFED